MALTLDEIRAIADNPTTTPGIRGLAQALLDETAAPAPAGAWSPAPACTHDGTCTSRNPWLCHHDEQRPRAGYETPQWRCTCTPCHAPEGSPPT